jgi:ribosomal protein L15
LGQVEAAFTVKIKKASKSAKEKINEAGGEVLVSDEFAA